MVFGLFEGGIELLTEKTSYSFGETVKGKIRLKLKQPKNAKALELRFWGEVTQTTVQFGSSTDTKQQKRIVSEVRVALDGEKEYFNQEYPFEFALPKRDAHELNDALKTIVGVAQTLTGGFPNTKWFLQARLDVPMSLDINKTMQLNIV